MKSDKLPQVMSLESALVGAEDYKFENVTSETSVAPRVCLFTHKAL